MQKPRGKRTEDQALVIQDSPQDDRPEVAWCAHGTPKPPTDPQGTAGIIVATVACERQPLVQMLLEQFGPPNVMCRALHGRRASSSASEGTLSGR